MQTFIATAVHRFVSRVSYSLWISLNNIHFMGSPPPPHRFTSNIFVVKRVTQPLPVQHFHQLFPSWRFTAFLKAWITIFYGAPVVFLYTNWEAVLVFYFAMTVISYAAMKILRINEAWGATDLVSSILELQFLFYLVFISTLANLTGIRSTWGFFWTTYFLFSLSYHHFSQNYLEAWRLTHPTHVITIFIDKINCINIPCPDPHDCNDLWLLQHLSLFYRMSRIGGGLFQAILPTSLVQIDIVELNLKFGEHNVGSDISRMGLHIQIPGQIENATFNSIPDTQRDYVDELVAKAVFRQVTTTSAQSTAKPAALNFVTRWDPFWLSVIVLSPTVASIAISVAWPAVAVLKYGADIQTSVQTATSLASYIVTTGALLIGLVTLFDALAK
ncbi:hypothetical protein GGS24DRAFT_289723 [Hypoxylon argillaceum]|nr:hypothetical protein GGS24DRAFT_289723 [Hypoxylon argillaceum]